MSTCLGLYVETNIIKYAKVSKSKDDIKVEAFGIKFYEDLNEAIEQIIEETYSFKVPISVNLSEEMYNYFNVFSMLKDKDLDKVIKNEFEFLCEEKGYNINALESRYMTVNDIESRENLRIINVSANKVELIKKNQQFEKHRLVAISSLPIAITNITSLGPKDNYIIVNIEEKTTITTILNGKVYKVEDIDQGMQNILHKINLKENSYAKSYEICKNTTIYTSEGLSSGTENNDYLEDIMPILYNIVKETKRVMDENVVAVEKVYITGSAAIINNIDLYFEQNIANTTCEILKPYFLNTVATNVNVKDYIEVNSAIALAMQGSDGGVKEINFKKTSMLDGLKVSGGKPSKEGKKKSSVKFDFNLKGALDPIEKNLVRSAASLLMVFVVYLVISIALSSMIKDKEKEVNARYSEIESQVSLATRDIETLNRKTSNYVQLKKNLDDLNAKIEEKYKNKNKIPNLLNSIMFGIPEGVQLLSIENTTGNHVVIKAQAEKYEQLGYFKAKLKSGFILLNVVSDSGSMQDSVIKVTIEGDLP